MGTNPPAAVDETEEPPDKPALRGRLAAPCVSPHAAQHLPVATGLERRLRCAAANTRPDSDLRSCGKRANACGAVSGRACEDLCGWCAAQASSARRNGVHATHARAALRASTLPPPPPTRRAPTVNTGRAGERCATHLGLHRLSNRRHRHRRQSSAGGSPPSRRCRVCPQLLATAS